MKTIKLSITILLFLISYIPIMAQHLERQVIATAGNSNVTSSFTIGEVVVSTNIIITAGFQQPEFMTEPVTSITDITNELVVFPVPTRDVVTIRGIDFQEKTTTATLYTIDGIETQITIERFENEMKLNLDGLPSGNYFLTLTNQPNLTIAKYKILKIK